MAPDFACPNAGRSVSPRFACDSPAIMMRSPTTSCSFSPRRLPHFAPSFTGVHTGNETIGRLDQPLPQGRDQEVAKRSTGWRIGTFRFVRSAFFPFSFFRCWLAVVLSRYVACTGVSSYVFAFAPRVVVAFTPIVRVIYDLTLARVSLLVLTYFQQTPALVYA